jgi:hypothetical protein
MFFGKSAILLKEKLFFVPILQMLSNMEAERLAMRKKW